jgi:serpin B
MRASLVAPLALCAWLTACNVTNTGNPNTNEGPAPAGMEPAGMEPAGIGPAGIELVRSQLQRETAPSLAAGERARFGSDNRQFAFDLYSEVKDESANMFFSPYSISVALAMTYAGALGETKQEMARALHFGLPEPALHAAFNVADLALERRSRELVNGASSGEGFQLKSINASFGREDTTFMQDYLDLLAVNYGAGMFRADFAGNPERERKAINDWVLEQTEQRVQELLPPGSIESEVRLVLVNAIYFKASWLTKFDPAETRAATFHASSGETSVQMMHGSAEDYARLADYQVLSLPYLSPAVRALFILPDDGAFAAVEARLDGALFDEARAALSPHSVDVKLPRFSFEAEIRLKAALEALGMRRAFGDADLSGISGPPGWLFIDEVYHKAFVALDEQGTEAAAATAAVLGGLSGLIRPLAEFVADRPFIFLIYDDPTGQILFVGRLSEPGA